MMSLGGTAFEVMGHGFKRQAMRALKIFESFFNARYGHDAITKGHIVTYMLYRVVGEDTNDLDAHSGACSLSTFMGSEVGPLISILNYQRRVEFSLKELYAFNDFIDKKAHQETAR